MEKERRPGDIEIRICLLYVPSNLCQDLIFSNYSYAMEGREGGKGEGKEREREGRRGYSSPTTSNVTPAFPNLSSNISGWL